MEASARTLSRLCSLLGVCYFVGVVQSQNVSFTCLDDTWTIKDMGTYCFKAFDAKLEYWDASRTCHAYGGYLADPQNIHDIQYIGDMASAAGLSSFWSGVMYTAGVASLDRDSTTVPLEQYFWNHAQPSRLDGAWYMTTTVVTDPPLYSYPYAVSWVSGRLRQGFICERPGCLQSQISCISGGCVTGTECDGEAECNDVSDELKCDSLCHYWQEGDSGSVESGAYENNANCRWTLVSEAGTRVKLEFSVFDTEQNQDQVEIWIGGPTQATATLSTRLSGSTLPSDPIYSTNNFMILVFTSDDSVSGSGFTASWMAEEQEGVEPEALMAGVSPAEIMSPNYPIGLQSNLRMTWLVTVRQRKIITVQVEEFNLLGAAESFVDVVDGPEQGGVRLAQLRAGANNPAYVMSVSNTLLLYLHTEAATPGAHFKFTYFEGCSIRLNITSGVIISPGYSLVDEYPNFLDCAWTVLSPTGDGFKAVADNAFSLEDGKDFLSVYDGEDDTGAVLLDKATGTSLATSILTSAAGHLHFVFTTNAAMGSSGFSIPFSTDCPALALSEFTTTSPDLYTISLNDAVTLSCMPGYEFGQEEHNGESSITITCTDSGWDVTQIPNCQPKCCGQPPQVNDGYVESSTGVSYQETVTYSCYTGLGISGSATIACQDDGAWETAPTCQEMTCTQITELDKGGVEISGMDGTRQGDILLFTCEDGYDLMGAAQLLCDAGQWSTDTPTCDPLICPLPDIANAQFFPTDVQYTGTIDVTCVGGYELVDGAHSVQNTVTLTCGVDQLFEELLPLCRDVDECLDVSTCTAPAECTNIDGSFVCNCPAGWQEDVNNPNACIDIAECAQDPPLCSGVCSEMDGTYQCDCDPDVVGPGHVLYSEPGAQSIPLAEGETGLLVGDIYFINHTCVATQCPDLIDLENGVIMSTKLHYYSGDVVYFDCNLGYQLNGVSMISCGSDDVGFNGEWVGVQPTCEVATCLKPNFDESMFPPALSAESAVYGDTVNFTCAQHQENPIMYERQCVFDQASPDQGQYRFLVDDIFECPVISCGDPVDVGGAEITMEAVDNYLDTMYTIACVSGFTFTGNNSMDLTNNQAQITCLATGNWDLGSLTCSGAQCPDPGTPLGGYQVLDVSYEVGRELGFACNQSGYTPNSGNLTCMLSGSDVAWSDAAPTACEDTEDPVFDNCPTVDLYIEKLTAPDFPSPTATDNTGIETFETDVVFDPSHVLTASVTVTYTATDFQGNQATCVVNIIVRDDQEKPVITCPMSYEFDLTSAEGGTVDYAAVPATADDGGSSLEVTYDPPSLNFTVNDLGSFVIVTASAEDSDGYVDTCMFMVKAKAAPCMDWALPAPVGGSKDCTADNAGGYSCTMTCDPLGTVPYFLYDFMAAQAVSELVYTCEAGGAWDRGDTVPACIAPVNAEYTLGATYPYEAADPVDFGACETIYVASLNTIIDGVVGKLYDFCTSTYLTEEGLSPEYIIQISATISEDSGMFGVHVEYAVGPDTLSTTTIRSCGDSIGTLAGQPAFNNFLKALASIPGDASCAALQLALGQDPQTLDNPTPGFNCDAEFSEGAFSDIDYCVPCPTGSFYDAQQDICVNCSKGMFQNATGQMSCLMCPDGKDTYGDGAASEEECIDQCDSFSMTSVTGLPPCNQCSRNHHVMDAMTCAECPQGTSYDATGAADETFCMAACEAGDYSSTGYEPCTKCPTAFHQTATMAMGCVECPDTQTTDDTGCIDAATLCDSHCTNGGTCSITNHLPLCECASGYTGSTCDIQIDFCESNPCYIGTCVPEPDAYTCNCPSGWTGDRCESDPDDCDQVSCPNAGQCYDHFDTQDHSCVCPEGFTGPACGGDDVCVPNECDHGTCEPHGSVRFTCACDAGYQGSLCDVDIDECASNPCLYGGTCQNLEDSYECMCPEGYTGINCETRKIVCDNDECGVTGVCVDDFHTNSYYCICTQGYERDVTDSDRWLKDIEDVNTKQCLLLDVCDPSPCENGATCNPMVNDYRCDCENGYSGKNCQHNTDDCASDPCQNGATCVDQVSMFQCNCTDGYDGTLCENDITECTIEPCFEEGTDKFASGSTNGCIDVIGDWVCACNDGFEGKDCSTNIDDCVTQPCLHGSTCVDRTDSYDCECVDGWEGPMCDDPVNQCTENPCLNGGTCFSVFDHYYCQCTETFFGQNCSLQASVCRDANPCIGEGSTCTESADGVATCECGLANTGECCHISKDFCAGDGVCVWGSCTASGGDFNCACYDDFVGDFCEASLDNCASASCANGGQCVDAISTYYCECPIGKSGIDCDKDLVESYDIYCFSTALDNLAYLAYPFVLNTTDWSLSVWVKYSTNGGTGTFLTLYGLKDRYIVSPKTELLRIDDAGVHVKFGGVDATAEYEDEQGGMYRINEGRWLNVVVTYDFALKELAVYLNGVKTGTIMSYGGISALQEFGYIELGTYSDPDTGAYVGFNGHISRVSVWNRVLDRNMDISMLGNLDTPIDNTGRILTWANFLTAFGCTFVPESTAVIIAEPPQPPADPVSIVCPADQYIVATQRDMQVTWTDPVPQGSNVAPVAIRAPGGLFTYGAYENAYIAIAEDRTTFAVCRFNIYVQYGNCANYVSEANTLVSCTAEDNYSYCSAECPPNKAITVNHPEFYTCGKLGTLNVRKPFTMFRIPACGALAGSGTTRTLRFTFNIIYRQVDNCKSAISVGGIKATVYSKLRTLNQAWKNSFCPNDCEIDVTIVTECGAFRRRRRRQTEDMSLQMTIPSVEDPIFDDAGTPSSPEDVLNLAIFDDNLLDPGSSVQVSPDLDNLVVTIDPTCDPGQIVTNDLQCVTCGPGSKHDVTANQCVPCDYGEYQPTEGMTNCEECGPSLTTENLNSVHVDACKPLCEAGMMFDGTDCVMCQKGWYQEMAGQFYCDPCGATKTTSGEGSTSAADCLDACTESGVELAADGSCVDCEIGSYREFGTDDACRQCDPRFITLTTRSVSRADCSVPACEAGQEINDNNDDCVDCMIGTYQPDKWQTTECKECPVGFSTANEGSVNMTQCLMFCPDGQEYNADTGACDACPIGYYKNNAMNGDLSRCVLCPVEFITAGENTTRVEDCNVGNCTPGEYLNPDDNMVCLPCEIGTYSDMKWATECTACSDQRNTTDVGADNVELCQLYCNAGKQSVTDSLECMDCPIGEYKPSAGLDPCTECPAGNITNNPGATSAAQCNIPDCMPGSYLTDTNICEPCMRGTYQPDGRQISCMACDASLTTLGTGKTDVTDCVTNCETGYGYDEAMSQCVICKQGFYRTKDVDDVCTICPVDRITPDEGSATEEQCTYGNCTQGEHRDDTDDTICVPCPRGFYQPYTSRWEADCMPCAMGLTTATEGAIEETECITDCPDGQELDLADNMCKACERGYYRAAAESFPCLMCEPTHVTEDVGSITSDDCTVPNCTTDQRIVGDVCEACPEGSVQPLWWQTSCEDTDHCALGNDCPDEMEGGLCTNTGTSFTCSCQDGYQDDGSRGCEHLCSASSPYCLNGGKCTFIDMSAPYCVCTEYYAGPTCQNRIEPPSDTATLIGGIIGGVVGIILLILCGLGVYWCIKARAPVKALPTAAAPPMMAAPMYVPTAYQPTYQPNYVPAPQYDGLGMVQTNRMGGSLAGSLGRAMYIPPGPSGSVTGYNTMPNDRNFMFYEDADDTPVQTGTGIRVQVTGQY